MARTISLLLILATAACGKAPLREDIPLYFGVRAAAEWDSTQFVRDLEKIKRYGGAGLTIELALERDAAGFPYLSDSVRQNAIRMGRSTHAAGLPVTWVWTRNENPPLFPPPLPDSALVFRSLLTAYFSVLDSVPRPERVIIGHDYKPLEEYAWECALAEAVKKRCGCKTSYMYGYYTEKTFSECFDEGAVAFPALSVEETRKSARIQHSTLPATAPRPLFVAAVNVLGWNKAKALENRRRFLPPKLSISGMTINSIYPRPAVCDSTTVYGMAQDTAALAEIRRWTKR